MNDKKIEDEIQEKGLTAPRITPEHIDMCDSARVLLHWRIDELMAKDNDLDRFYLIVLLVVLVAKLLFACLILYSWNMLANVAGWHAVVPINFGTVIGLSILIAFIKSVFKKR